MKKLIILITAVVFISCKAQDVCTYSEKYVDSLKTIIDNKDNNCDSLQGVADYFEALYDLVKQSTTKYGNHNLYIIDTIANSTSSLRVIDDQAWMEHGVENGIRVYFWVVNRNGKRNYEIWMSNNNNPAYKIMNLDSSQFTVNYNYLNILK